MTNPNGIDSEGVTRWLIDHVGAVPPVGFDLLAGGRSNLTYRASDAGGRAWVLRRPPTGGVLATAHDMRREWRFLSALFDTPVPVPKPLAYCADTEVTGAPFYLMNYVDCIVLTDGERVADLHDEKAALRVAESTVDVLAALHQVDPSAVGLDDFRRPGNSIERQLRRWHQQAQASPVEDANLLDDVHRRLLNGLPSGGSSIVHGDFRPGNIGYDAAGTAVAVFDWELATIGDPLTDVAWLLGTWSQAGDPWPPLAPGPTESGIFPNRDVLISRYEALCGDIPDLRYYSAFARWRIASISAGVIARYRDGHMGNDGFDYQELRQHVVEQGEAARQLLLTD